MSIATLADIIVKTRRLTGSATDFELTDAQIIDYIDSFYLYDFPAQYRSLKLKDKLVFNTQRGIDTYPFNMEKYTTIQQPVFCAKRSIQLFYDQWQFFGFWYNWQYQETLTQGNGNAGPYAGSTTATPIIRSYNNNPAVTSPLFSTGATESHQPAYPQTTLQRVQNLLITVNISYGSTLNVTDDGAGNLIGDCLAGGTINYETGAVANLTFTQMVPSGQNITIQYGPATLAIPQAIMFFQNQFTLRPVPDKGYTIEIVAYRQPSQAILGTENPDEIDMDGTPELLEWWECLAFGAAKKIYQDRLDTDGVEMMNQYLQEAYQLAFTRTYAELGKNQMQSIFADQLNNNSGSGSGWFGGQGSGS